MSDGHTHSPEPESSGLAGYAAIKLRRARKLTILPSSLGTSSRPSTGRMADASEDGLFEPAPNAVERDQTLLQELVWSLALIGGVVAYLVLVVQRAS